MVETIHIPELDGKDSILHVTDESGNVVLEIRKLPKRVIIVAEVDGDEFYKIREDSNDSHVAVVDMKSKKVVEKFRNKKSDTQASENFRCSGFSIFENEALVAKRVKGEKLRFQTDYENHALLVAVYIAVKKLVSISDGNLGEALLTTTCVACCCTIA